MKKVSELGLEVIELEDQVLLVDSKWKYKDEKISIYLDTISIKSNATLSGWFGIGFVDNHKELIASTKPLEGLPLLVIEDEVDKITKNEVPDRIYKSGVNYAANEQLGFKKGYSKAKETYKFTEEDMGDLIEICIDLQEEGRLIRQIDAIQRFNKTHKKELWIEFETELDAYYRNGVGGGGRFPKITNNQIKAVYK